MQCAVSGCSHKAQRQCAECLRHFCGDHIEVCGWCQAPVCRDCRDAHEASPLHDEGARETGPAAE